MVGTTPVTPFCLNFIFLASLPDDYRLSFVWTITLTDDFDIISLVPSVGNVSNLSLKT